MAIVSDIEIRLRADIARLQQDMDAAQRSVSGAMGKIGSAVKVAGAAFAALGVGMAVGALSQWIKKAIDATDVVSDLSQKTGVAVKDIAGLQLWFQKGGMGAGSFESAMVKLSRNIAEGGDAFDRLGIKTKDSGGALRSNVEVLKEAADKFANLQDGTLKTALAVELFGKTGADLIPMLNEGSQGLQDMAEMADKLGLTFDEKTVEAAGKFNDTLDFMAGAGQGVARQLAAQLLPTLNALASSMLTLITTGNGVKQAADVIGAGFKILYTIGVGLVEIFRTVGSTIGAAAAQLVAILQGDFKTAIGIGRGWATDMKDSWSVSAKAISDAWTGAGSSTLEALVATSSASTVVADKVDKDAKKQGDAYRDLVTAIRLRVKETDAEIKGLAPLNDAQKMALKLDEELASGKLTLSAVQQKTVRGLIEEYNANLQAVESQKAYKAMQDDIEKDNSKAARARQEVIDKAKEEADANEELVRTFGMTKAAVAALEVSRLEAQLAQRSELGLTWDEIEALKELIVQKKRSAEAIANVEDLEKQRALWGDIEKTAHDTFVSIIDGGKGAAQRLKETFKNVFFDWLYQMTLKKWIIQLAPSGSMDGAGGGLASFASGIANAYSGGGGSSSGILGNASSLFSAGKFIYQGFTSGFATTLGTMISNLGSTFGSAAVAEFGAGMAGTTAATTSGAAGAGASSASAVPVIGWIIAGMAAANKFYKEGFDIHNGTVKDPLGLGSGIRVFDNLLRGIGLSNSVANIFSGQATFAKLFGRAAPRIEEQGLRGTVGAGGFSGEAYAKILEKGGIFRSDKRYEKTAALSAEQDKSFDDTIVSMITAIKGFGAAMGLQTSVIDGYSKAIKLVLTGDAKKDQETITALFQGIGDELATALLPSLTQFAKEGENATTTLQRLAMNFTAVTDLMRAIGVDASKAFGTVAASSIEARERLITLAGGLDALAQQTEFFAQNFLTSAQQLAPVQKHVAEQLAALGYAGVDTADAFRDAVLGLANGGQLATEAGAKTYAALLALAPAFKQVADAAEEARAAQVDALRTTAGDMFSALERAVNSRKAQLQDSFAKLMDHFGDAITAQQTKVSKLQGLSSALRGARVGGVAEMQAADSRVAAQAQIAAALALARSTGYLPDADTLRDALSTVQRDAADQFSSFFEYQRDALLTQNSIEELSGLTDNQLSTAERTLAVLERQRDAAQAAYDAEILRLDGMLISAQLQLDAVNGVNVTATNILAAMSGFQASIAAAMGNATIAAGPSIAEAKVEGLYQSVFGRNSDSGGLSYWSDMMRKGMTEAQIRDAFYSSAEYANMQQSGKMSGNSAVVSELQTLNSRMANMETAVGQTAAYTRQTAGDINRVTAGGNIMRTEAV
jgi:hypothetical protein